MKTNPFIPHLLPAITIAGLGLTFLLAAPDARSAPGSASSAPFTLDTRNLEPSSAGTVHTDKRAYVTDDTVSGSLRQAIANAIAGETVDFDAGLDGGTIILGGTQLAVNKNLTIDGAGLAAGVSVSGNEASRVFAIANNSNVTIDSLTITGGKFAAGGGIFVQFGSTLELTDSVVSGNESGSFGGGINNFGTLTITDSTISDNHATTFGAGLANNGGLTIRRSTFTGNNATTVGGGIYTQSNTVLIENSTISQNTAGTARGAGIWSVNADGDLTLRHVTVAGNTVTSGILSGAGVAAAAITTLALENTIIADNQTTSGGGSDLFGDLAALGRNLVENHDGNVDSGPAVITTDPMLGPLADNGGVTQTMLLQPGSPAIDTGGVLLPSPPATDQRGATRPLDGNGDTTAAPDIGAFETLPALAPFVPDIPTGTIRSALDNQVLTWNITGAPLYRFYFGTDENAVVNAMPDSSEDKGTVIGNGFVPSPVPSGGTFFWRVDTVFGDLEIPGAVQSFGTITPQPDTRIGTKDNPATHKEIAKVTLKGRRTGKLYASVRNDGDNTDALKLSRIAANKTMKLKSFRLTGGRQNITAALKRGSYVTPALAPGEWVVIQTQAKAKKTKARQTLKYIAASQVVPAVVDGAKGKVKSGKK